MIALIAAIAAAGWHHRTILAERARFLDGQRQCMTYAPPSDLVVLDTDPQRGTALAASDPRYHYVNYERTGAMTWLRPSIRGKHPITLWEPGPAFVHARSAKGAGRRIVGVDLAEAMLPDAMGFYVHVMKPATWLTDPRTVGRPRPVGDFWFSLTEGETIRVFAGQADANDPSHFTIEFDLSGRRGTIDGWLRANETIDLRPRDAQLAATRWFTSFDLLRHRRAARLSRPTNSSHRIAEMEARRNFLKARSATRPAASRPAAARIVP
jgi:hypothetical protein